MGVQSVLKKVVRKMRGWRTLAFSLIVAGLGVA